MSLLRSTVRGAMWTISSALGSRAIGLVGTLALTRFVAPADYGEVMVAAVLVMTANQLSTWGFGQYLVSRPDAGRAAAFHVTVFHGLLGVAALGLAVVLGPSLAPWLAAPDLSRFLPGLAAAALIDRASFVPERILTRDLRFGMLSMMRTSSDLTYTAVSVAMAAAGWGATAVVVGNLGRSVVRFAFAAGSVSRRDWLEACPISLGKTRELMSFGVPVAVASLGAFAARRWDNLLVSRYFGPATTGMYNLAYNLADVPAIYVGEQLGDVLLPSFARLEPERRPAALLRSLGLLALVIFPLAVGLGVISPTLVGAVFDERWQPIAPMLLILAALSVARPVSWTIAAYLQAQQKPSSLMGLELAKLVMLVASIVAAGKTHPLLTCGAVGMVYAAHMLGCLAVVCRMEKIPMSRALATLAPALSACLPMIGAVLLARHLLGSSHAGTLGAVLVEVVAGAFAYAAAAGLLARPASRDLAHHLGQALRRQPS